MRISDWSSDVCSSDLNLSQRIKRSAITRINGKRSFERIIGARQIAHFLGGHALGKPGGGQRVYLRIRLLPVASARYCRKRQRQSNGSRGKAHNFLQQRRSEEHTSELQSLMRISYAVFCLKKQQQHSHKNKLSGPQS